MTTRPGLALESAIPDGPPRVDVDLAAELLRRGRPIEVVTRGSSMWPLLRPNERVRIEPVVGVRPGDLAAIRRDGYLLVHRIVRVDGGTCVLRGDNLGREDGEFAVEAIAGVVTLHWTRGGRCIDHRTWVRRRWARVVAFVASRTRIPWRVARVAYLVVKLGRRAWRAG